MIKHLTKLALVLCVWAAPHTARAGIPVIDVASLAEAIAQVTALGAQLEEIVKQYKMMEQQYETMTKQVDAIKGARGLGGVLNNPGLQNYVPKNARTILDAVQSGGYGGLSGSARALRDVGRVYNCEGIDDSTQRQACEAELNKPYQYLAYVQDALQAGANRTDQINALMDQAGSTGDAKEIAEIQARIGAENALLQHELTQATLMRNMAQAEAQAAEARARELQRARAARNGKMGGIAGGAP